MANKSIAIIGAGLSGLTIFHKLKNAADITLFDPEKKWTYNKENNNSKSENTPLFGSELKGSVLGTILGRNYHRNTL